MSAVSEAVEFWIARLDFGAVSPDALLDRWAFRWAERESFYEYLASQLGNEVILRNAIETYRTGLLKRGRRRTAMIVGDIGRRVRDGGWLATAVRPWTPPDERMTIASGENSGRLPAALDLLIEARDRTSVIKRIFIRATWQPAVYLVAVYVLMIYIGAGFLPSMTKAAPNTSYHGLGAVLIGISELSTTPFAILPPLALMAIVFIIARSMERWTGPARRYAERIFPWSYYRDINGYMWLQGFTAMQRSGMDVGKVIEEQMVHSSPWLRERLEAIHQRVSDGQALGRALVESGFEFPQERLIDSVVATAGFADFGARMDARLARWLKKYEGTMQIKAELMGLGFELLILVLVAVIVLGFASIDKSMASVVHIR